MNIESYQNGLNEFMSLQTYSSIKTTLEDLGLNEITSPRQILNGTIMFEDPQATNRVTDWSDDESWATDEEDFEVPMIDVPVKYGIFKSGACRRYTKNGLHCGGYRLNKKTTKKMPCNYYTKGFYYQTTGRILLPSDYIGLCDILLGPIKNYRKNHPPLKN